MAETLGKYMRMIESYKKDKSVCLPSEEQALKELSKIADEKSSLTKKKETAENVLKYKSNSINTTNFDNAIARLKRKIRDLKDEREKKEEWYAEQIETANDKISSSDSESEEKIEKWYKKAKAELQEEYEAKLEKLNEKKKKVVGTSKNNIQRLESLRDKTFANIDSKIEGYTDELEQQETLKANKLGLGDSKELFVINKRLEELNKQSEDIVSYMNNSWFQQATEIQKMKERERCIETVPKYWEVSNKNYFADDKYYPEEEDEEEEDDEE